MIGQYPLYIELLKYSRADKSEYQHPEDQAHAVAQSQGGNEDEPAPWYPKKLSADGICWQAKGWRHDYDEHLNFDEQTRNDMMIDETFAIYLYTVSKKVNPTFYRMVLAFMIFYRECLNHIGWTKRVQSEEIDLTKNPEL